MARPKLNKIQRETLLGWLAADYETGLITQWFKECDWPELTRASFCYYRKRYFPRIEELRKARLDSALNTGLALKEERVTRLKEHADALDAIKWEPDDKGRLWNEKAWRETLEDIAAETGGRKQQMEINPEGLKVIVEYANAQSNTAEPAPGAAADQGGAPKV